MKLASVKGQLGEKVNAGCASGSCLHCSCSAPSMSAQEGEGVVRITEAPKSGSHARKISAREMLAMITYLPVKTEPSQMNNAMANVIMGTTK
jgi:hypothetical protein